EAPGLAITRPTHTLLVWGPGVERGRVMFDGVPLDAPLHVAGLIAAIDEDILARGTARASGAPARYDGGLDYVFDLETREPGRALRTWGGVDPLVLRAGVEGPFWRGAGWMNVRRINSETTAWLTGREFGYAYADMAARYDAPIAGGIFAAVGIATRE